MERVVIVGVKTCLVWMQLNEKTHAAPEGSEGDCVGFEKS